MKLSHVRGSPRMSLSVSVMNSYTRPALYKLIHHSLYIYSLCSFPNTQRTYHLLVHRNTHLLWLLKESCLRSRWNLRLSQTHPMSSCFCASAEVMRLEDHVIFYNTRAKPSWYACARIMKPSGSSRSLVPQLDAGQHPAFDGLAALPYFDEFDLSTVDVLLISQ